jgi:hypothetical protein
MLKIGQKSEILNFKRKYLRILTSWALRSYYCPSAILLNINNLLLWRFKYLPKYYRFKNLNLIVDFLK